MAAAELIYEQGVHLTNNESVRAAAGVSGSQLGRHFPTKESLVRAVIVWRADRVVQAHRIPEFGRMDSFAALRAWAEAYVDRDDMCRGGCSFGSLASEVLKSGLDVRREVADGFESWESVFRTGLQAMRDRGDLSPRADPRQLAHMILAAFQGGMLLGQAAGGTEALRASLGGVISYIESFATGAEQSGLGSP